LAYGEYGHIRRQIRFGEAEFLCPDGHSGRLGFYRVQLFDGTALDVLAWKWTRKGHGKNPRNQGCELKLAMPPLDERRAAPTPPPPAPAPPEPAVPTAPEPPPPPVLRASTLTFGMSAPSAAEVLAARLRPKPLPPRAESAPVPKAARAQGRR
jgi:hypothetical protein